MAATTIGREWIDEALSYVSVTATTRHAPAQVAAALLSAADWLGTEIDSPALGQRRFAADMRLRVSDSPRLVVFRKAAFIDLGQLHWLYRRWEAEVSWRASSLAPLFPVFSGRMVASEGELSLSGWYAPPFGVLGQVADGVLLHVAATGTARWLLGALDAAARTEVRTQEIGGPMR